MAWLARNTYYRAFFFFKFVLWRMEPTTMDSNQAPSDTQRAMCHLFSIAEQNLSRC